MFSSQIASDYVHSKWRGDSDLARSETLLPAYLDGVNYTGFGKLVRHGEKKTRKVTMGKATISLPANGDPIDSIEISGFKYSRLPCRLSLMAGNKLLAREWLPNSEWKVSIRPEPVWHPASQIQLSLHFLGPPRCIEIDHLEIVTKAKIGKGQPREILSRIPENPHWAKNENIVFEEIFEHPECLRLIQFSGGEPLIHPAFSAIVKTTSLS